MKSASPDIRLFFGQGSPMAEITSYVTSDVPLKDDGIIVDTTTYGDTAVDKSPVGVSDPPDVELSMLFDDIEDGPMEVFPGKDGPNTPPYTLQVFWTTGSPASYSTWICGIKSVAPMPKVKDVTRWVVTLYSRGPITHYRQGA